LVEETPFLAEIVGLENQAVRFCSLGRMFSLVFELKRTTENG